MTGTLESRCELVDPCSRLGYCCQLLGEYAKAREYFEQCLEISREIEKTVGTEESSPYLRYSLLAYSYYLLCSVLDEEAEATQEMLKEAVRIYEMLAEQYPSEPAYATNAEFLREYIA